MDTGRKIGLTNAIVVVVALVVLTVTVEPAALRIFFGLSAAIFLALLAAWFVLLRRQSKPRG